LYLFLFTDRRMLATVGGGLGTGELPAALSTPDHDLWPGQGRANTAALTATRILHPQCVHFHSFGGGSGGEWNSEQVCGWQGLYSRCLGLWPYRFRLPLGSILAHRARVHEAFSPFGAFGPVQQLASWDIHSELESEWSRR